jgi:hypothetical protein
MRSHFNGVPLFGVEDELLAGVHMSGMAPVICGLSACGNQACLFLNEGDVFQHVLLKLGRVVLEVDGDEGAVAKRVDFLEAIRGCFRRRSCRGVWHRA